MTVRLNTLLLLLIVRSTRVAAWDLTPDPPPVLPTWKPADKLAVVCPIPADHLSFAGQDGPFALVDATNGRANVRRVYDLRTGAATGEMPKPKYHLRSALDQTGTTIAAVEIENKRDVILYNVVEKKETARVTLEREPSTLHFLSADRLLAHAHFPTPQHFTVLDARTGAIVKTWSDTRLSGAGVAPALSPGSRYFASGMSEVLVFDLRDGKLAATLPLERPWLCRGTAFSADGQQLAAFLFKGKEHQLKVWSLEDGKTKTIPLPFAKDAPAAFKAPVQAVLDGGWFIEQEHIVDATGKLVRSLPVEVGVELVRRAIRTDLVIGVRKVEGWFDLVLSAIDDKPVPVPDRPVGMGGFKGPVAFPPATQADLSAVRALGPVKEVQWGGPLDGNPGPRRRFAVNVPTGGQQVQGLHISRDGGQACVELNLSNVRFADVEAGTSIASEMPTTFRIVGDSLDGSGWMTSDGAARVDLFDKSGKHVAGWKPDGTNNVVYAAALANNLAVTVTANGKVTLWSMPTCRAIWTADVRLAEAACLSPGGKFLLVIGGTTVSVINLEDGTTHGLLATEPAKVLGVLNFRRLVVRPDGKELALITPDPDGLRRVILWNLEVGKLSGSFLAQTVGNAIHYVGPDHLAVDWLVFDLRRQAQVWQFGFAANPGFALHAPSDGRIWYTVAGQKQGDLAIVPGELSSADVTSVTASVADAPNSLLKSGEKVRVEVRFDRAPGRLRTDAEDAVEKMLRTRGFMPDANGPVTLRVTGTRKETGKKVQITDTGTPAPGVTRPTIETLTVYDVVFKPELERDGKVIWSGREATYEMGIDRLTHTITIPDDKMTATEFFGRKVWGMAVQMAGSVFTYPITFAAQVNGEIRTLPGQSTLTANGITTQWPAGYVPKERDQVERAPAERAVLPSTQQPAGGPVGANNTGGLPLRWILIAGGGLLVMMLLGGVLLIVMLKRKVPGRKTPRPPPLPWKRKD